MVLACPPLRIKCGPDGNDRHFCVAQTNRREVGELELTERGEGTIDVTWVGVEKLKRCGIGTKLYQSALEYSCKLGRRLRSDLARSDGSEFFWRKQVRKGRASCIERGVGAEHVDQETMSPTGRRWQCKRFAMKEVCPSSYDLSGLRKRKKHR